MKLYYLFPKEYLQNFSFNIITDNTLAGAMTGYASVAYFAPFFFVIYILKFIPVNAQALMYGLNFACGFLFFYKFLSLYITGKDTNWRVFISKTLASIFYVFFPILNETLYSHQLMHMYLISILPATLYFFILGVRNKNLKAICLSILIFSIFSTTYNGLPFTAAFAICLIPLMLYEFWKNKKSFLIYLVIAGITFLFLNLFWIFHIVYGVVHNTGLTNSVALFSSGDASNDNLRIVAGVSRMFSPLNQVFLTLKSGVYTLTSLSQILSVVFLAVILIAVIALKNTKNEVSTIFYLFLLSLMISWFLFMPNFGNWGPNLFLYFTSHVPLWGMFRNMYDKFSLTFGFFYAASFGVSLAIIAQSIKGDFAVKVLFSIIILVLFFNIPRVLNPFTKDRESLTRISGEFNQDYTELISYVKSIPDASRIAWLPLNAPTYASIEDTNGNFYTGLSPMRILANKSDFAGRFSFLTQQDVYLGDKVFQWLKEGDYARVAATFQNLNIGYLIIDHQLPPPEMQSFFYGGEKRELLDFQGEQFQKEILGLKVRDFGHRYSLYTINTNYANDTLFLADNYNDFPVFPTSLTYTKEASFQYNGEIKNLNENKKFIFLDPFNSDWTLYLVKNGKDIPYKSSRNIVAHGYANAWDLDYAEIKNDYTPYITLSDNGSVDFKWKLYFEPQKYNKYVYLLSLVTFILTISYIIIPKR